MVDTAPADTRVIPAKMPRLWRLDRLLDQLDEAHKRSIEQMDWDRFDVISERWSRAFQAWNRHRRDIKRAVAELR